MGGTYIAGEILGWARKIITEEPTVWGVHPRGVRHMLHKWCWDIGTWRSRRGHHMLIHLRMCI